MKENGLLLVNLGSPRSTSVADVRQYLAEFLGDPNVIEMPRWFWKPILHGMILRSRPAKSAQLYREIWTDAGSPLIVYTYNLTKKVRTLLPDWEVTMAMTYGQPTIASQITKLQQKCHHITVLPLFPHYSKSTTKSIIDQVAAVAPNATIIKRFGGDDAYIALLVNRINQLWTAGDYDQLFVSYHGVPVSVIKRGDPYQDEKPWLLRASYKQL